MTSQPTFEEAWAALFKELELWPGWHLTEIHASTSSSTFHEGKHEGTWYRATSDDSWCARTMQDGWAEKDWMLPFYLHWAKTPSEALMGVCDQMKLHRETPHVEHIDSHRFLPDCSDCRRDWTEGEYEGALDHEVVYAP